MKYLDASSVRSPKFLAVLIALSIAMSCNALSPGDLSKGGLPNLNAPTFGGTQLWADVAWADDWRVQRHVWSRHHRLLDPTNTRRAWGSEEYCSSLLPKSQSEHLVVLLHGLGRTRNSLRAMGEELEAEGFQVASISYPSTRASIEEHARSVELVLDDMSGVERVSFVTHSLGGRVVLRLLEREGEWRNRIELGRVVQLAPPNRGSSLARQLENVPFVGCVMGPAFFEVAEPSSEEIPSDCEFGVIAAERGSLFGWNPLLLGDDDGVVAVHETRASFAHEHLRVNGVHTILMNDEDVLAATSRFLKSGSFGS